MSKTNHHELQRQLRASVWEQSRLCVKSPLLQIQGIKTNQLNNCLLKFNYLPIHQKANYLLTKISRKTTFTCSAFRTLGLHQCKMTLNGAFDLLMGLHQCKWHWIGPWSPDGICRREVIYSISKELYSLINNKFITKSLLFF